MLNAFGPVVQDLTIELDPSVCCDAIIGLSDADLERAWHALGPEPLVQNQ